MKKIFGWGSLALFLFWTCRIIVGDMGYVFSKRDYYDTKWIIELVIMHMIMIFLPLLIPYAVSFVFTLLDRFSEWKVLFIYCLLVIGVSIIGMGWLAFWHLISAIETDVMTYLPYGDMILCAFIWYPVWSVIFGIKNRVAQKNEIAEK